MKKIGRSFVAVSGLALLLFTIGCASTESGDVESRAVPGPQRMKTGAVPGGEFQLPSWPQKFDVQGPEADSFGFAVTQPGPVIVDVQATGAPVVVTLRGQGTAPVQQQGSGQVRLTYQVTPQDVQKGLLWAVQVRLAQPIPPPPGARASGTVMAQFPQVNQAVAQAQANALMAQRQALRQQPDPQAQAKLDAAFQEHKAKFEQEQQQKRAAASAQAQPLINQIRNQRSQQGQVQPRGIEEPQPGDMPVQAEGDVGTRGLRSNQTMSTIQQQPLTEVPSQFGGRTPLTPTAAPAPTITQLNIGQGQPLQPVIITGTHFGTQQANVVFVIAPNVGTSGKVEAWSDTLIVVDVPDQSGLMAYDGKVFVSTAGGNTNEVPFRFLPAQETRLISKTTDMVLAPPSGSGIGDHVWHGPNNFWEMFVGNKGNDVLFPGSRLKNGWTVQTVFAQNQGTGSEGVWVVDWRPATDTPFMNVRWWYDAFNEIRYTFGVYIVGPKGVPDGVAVP